MYLFYSEVCYISSMSLYACKVSSLFIDVGVCFQTLEGISDIRDESDRNGMRVVIEVLHCFLCT